MLNGHVDGWDVGSELGLLLGCIVGNDVGCLDGLETSTASDEGRIRQWVAKCESSHMSRKVSDAS